jgi:hypothetical protein
MQPLISDLPLSASAIDDVRRMIARDKIDDVVAVNLRSLSLEGAFELACAWSTWRQLRSTRVLRWIEEGARSGDRKLARAIAALEAAPQDAPGPHEAPRCEIRSTPKPQEDPLAWNLFLQRFRRSVVQNGGFSGIRADGLTKSLHEMADNVLQHAGAKAIASGGVVGYEINAGRATYAVADQGCGLLASLHRHPRWRSVTDAENALIAAVRDGASERSGRNDGEGFREIYRALADEWGVLRFRTGDAALVYWTVVGGSVRQRYAGRPPMPGFQLAVRMTRDQPPRPPADGTP